MSGPCAVPCNDQRRHDYPEHDRSGNPVTLHTWEPPGARWAGISTAETLTPDGILYEPPTVVVWAGIEYAQLTLPDVHALVAELLACADQLEEWQTRP